MRPFGVIILEEFIDSSLKPWDVLRSVFQIPETLLPKNAVEPFYECLLVLLVRSRCPDALDMPFGVPLPFFLELRSSVPLDMLDAPEESYLSFKRILSRARIQSRLKDDTRLSRKGIDSREGKDSSKVDGIGLDGFPRLFSSSYVSALAISLPFGTQDVFLVEDPVYR